MTGYMPDDRQNVAHGVPGAATHVQYTRPVRTPGELHRRVRNVFDGDVVTQRGPVAEDSHAAARSGRTQKCCDQTLTPFGRLQGTVRIGDPEDPRIDTVPIGVHSDVLFRRELCYPVRSNWVTLGELVCWDLHRIAIDGSPGRQKREADPGPPPKHLEKPDKSRHRLQEVTYGITIRLRRKRAPQCVHYVVGIVEAPLQDLIVLGRTQHKICRPQLLLLDAGRTMTRHQGPVS